MALTQVVRMGVDLQQYDRLFDVPGRGLERADEAFNSLRPGHGGGEVGHADGC